MGAGARVKVRVKSESENGSETVQCAQSCTHRAVSFACVEVKSGHSGEGGVGVRVRKRARVEMVIVCTLHCLVCMLGVEGVDGKRGSGRR